jgi:large subunit ribosomal protein L31e
MVEEKTETKVEEKKTKKLEDLKETPENKEAIAKSEGKVAEEVKPKASKPAVAKVSKKAEKKAESSELEREYVVPMRKGFLKAPHYRRAKKAVKTLKEFMVKHMNIRDGDLRKVKVDINLNNKIWFRGIKKPLHKINVKAVKKDGIVHVTLSDPADYVKFKIKKEKVIDNDKDKDGVDDKFEEKEDARSEAEKDAKNAKVEAKTEKRSAKGEHKQKIASEKTLK